MSKTSANEKFARLVQTHLADTGHYPGSVDGWAGPLTTSAYREFAGLAPDPAPPVDIHFPDDLPKPASSYVLPAESSSALNAFYGAASPSGSGLDWFSFPDPGTRLYHRGGTLLKDHVEDDRQDHRCHRMLTGRLTAALAEIYALLGRDRYRAEGWHVYGGCFNYRTKTGGSSLSTHAWGIAVDINPAENPWKQSRTTFSAQAIDVMERWGFLSAWRAWGHDAMHFQAAVPSISSGSHYGRHGLPRNIVRA